MSLEYHSAHPVVPFCLNIKSHKNIQQKGNIPSSENQTTINCHITPSEPQEMQVSKIFKTSNKNNYSYYLE